jgi:prepilin signal peptidase PulO-like enzyme (type II secretory pathway)
MDLHELDQTAVPAAMRDHLDAGCLSTFASGVMEFERPARWQVRELWRISGFDDSSRRWKQFAAVLLRPPLVSNTTPTVRVEVLVPARTSLNGAVMLATAFVVLFVGSTMTAFAPWLARPVILALAVAAFAEIGERAVLTWRVPKGHVRLQDVVAEVRGSGMGEAAVKALLERVFRPVVLNVKRDKIGVVAMYERCGFEIVGKTETNDELTMVRIGRPVGEWPNPAGVDGLYRWNWPSLADCVPGLIGTAALLALYAPETWSRQFVVATNAFVTITAARTDWRIQRIPNVVSVGGFAVMALFAVRVGEVQESAVGVALMAGPLLASNVATRGRTPGLGDVKLAAAAGAGLGMLSTTASLAASLLALFGGGVFGVFYQRHRGTAGFPLGPAIAAAAVVVLAEFGAQLRGWT